MATRAEIKAYFEAGKRPSQGNFAELIDRIPMVNAAAGTVEYWNDGLGQFETAQFGGLAIRTAKLFIPAADVLTLSTSPVPFGLNVPAGHYVKTLGCDFVLSGGTTAFATNTDLVVIAIGASDEQMIRARALEFNPGKVNVMHFVEPSFSATSDAIVDGADMIASVVGGNPTAGDRDLTIYLTYVLIEV